MEAPIIEKIKDKLKHIPDEYSQEIIDYIDFLTYKDSRGFELTPRHLELMEEADKTPIDECISYDKFAKELKQKSK